MKTCLSRNMEVLRQGEALVGRLDDAAYCRVLEPLFESSIGGHVRHSLDHYGCFLAGLERGIVDYAAREREQTVERCRMTAVATFARLRGALERVADRDRPLRVRGEGEAESPLRRSSMARELDFLLSHSIHHYAIMALMCRVQGIDVVDGFGVAPSTLRFRARQKRLARPAQSP